MRGGTKPPEITSSIGDSCCGGILQFGKDVLASERKIRRVIDFSPGKSRGARRAYHDSSVSQVLHANVKKIVDPAGSNQTPHGLEKSALHSQRDSSHPNVSSAEFISRDA